MEMRGPQLGAFLVAPEKSRTVPDSRYFPVAIGAVSGISQLSGFIVDRFTKRQVGFLVTVRKGQTMSRQEEIRRSVEWGKVAVQRGAVIARHVVDKVSAVAVRQSEIALLILKEISSKLAGEIRRQAIAAWPVIQKVSRNYFTFLHSQSKYAGRMITAGAQHFRIQMAPRICAWSQQHPRGAQMSLIGAGCLFGMIVLASAGWCWVSSSAEIPLVTTHRAGQLIPSAEISSTESALRTELETPQPSTTGAQSQQVYELQHRRLKAQAELEQAATNYDYVLGQWNADVAACQQSGPPPGYTPQQMGRFAAMAVRLEMQRRQPNQALLYAAQQAEHLYSQARDNCQRLATAQ